MLKIMKNLIGITDFVLEQGEKGNSEQNRQVFVTSVLNYASFLKQPLELWMFVPFDDDGNALEFPDESKDYIFRGETMRQEDIQDYKQAKERCLFEGFEAKHKITVVNDDIQIIFYKSGIIELVEIFDEKMPDSKGKIETIEDLVKYNLELTATAQKQIGL